MKHSVKDWIFVTRFWSFSVSAMPVVVTFFYLCSRQLVVINFNSIINFLLSLIGVVVLHAAGNVLSDWYDYRKGVDNEKAYATPYLVFGKFMPSEYLKFSLSLFVIGICIGLFLVLRTDWFLLILGVIGVGLTALYSFLKYHAFGDLDIFVIFSVLIIAGTSYTTLGYIELQALILSLPIGIITVSVLHANNTRDMQSDAAAGIKTLAMLLGTTISYRLYIAYMLIPFVSIVAFVIAGLISPFALISLIAFLPAFKNIKSANLVAQNGNAAMVGLDQASAKLQLVFTGLLSIGFLIAAIIA